MIAFQTREVFAAFSSHQGVPSFPLVIILTAGLLILVLRVFELALGDMLGYDYVKTLRVKLFNHISRLSTDNLQKHKQGSLQIRFVGDLSAMQNWVGQAIPGLISAIILMPGLLYLLYWLHPTMAMVGILLTIACILIMHILASGLKDVHQDVRSKRGGLASFVSARLTKAPLLRVMGLRAKLCDQILLKSNKLQRSAVKKSVIVNSFKGVPDMFLQALYLSCIILAFHFQLSAAEAAVILAVIAIFHQPFKNVADFWDKRNAYLVSRNKCIQLLSTRTVSRGRKTNMKQAEIDNVRIKAKQLVLNNIALPDTDISASEHSLISGPNGSGKSAFLKTLLGINAPQRGNLFIDDAPAALLTETSRRRLFAFIGDDTPIYSASLKNNLLLGVSRRTDTAVVDRAISHFGLSVLVERLGGLKGQVNENGNNLSKSEIARIACCRAWLSSARFILIDDIDSLVAIADEYAVNHLLSKANTCVIACSKHQKKWQPMFSNVYSLSPPMVPKKKVTELRQQHC